jgi:uncharacterized protein
MAQSNVAREPSMDEILASIRKIIESNEPGMPGFPANDTGIGQAGAYRTDESYAETEDDDDIHLTIDDEVLAAEFEAAEEEARPVETRHEATPNDNEQPDADAGTPPLSLADVAARVRAASERHAGSLRPQESDAGARSRGESPLVTSRMVPAPAAKTVESAASGKSGTSPAEGAASARSEGLGQAPIPAAIVEAAQHLAVISQKDAAAIVSPSVGAQVARSFEDLAQAVDSGPRRSFDEIAEDMLRPMLQEWLDDNLPTLVERLVREEIERVARGPRR